MINLVRLHDIIMRRRMDFVMGNEGIVELTDNEKKYLLSRENLTVLCGYLPKNGHHNEVRPNEDRLNETPSANTASNTTGRQQSRMNVLQTFLTRFRTEKITVK